MNNTDQSFDWDDLLFCINNQQVIPIVGKELITLRLDDKEISLERYIAERLASAFNIPTDELPPDFGLDDVALQCRPKDYQKIYRKIYAILTENPLPVPEALEKLAAITDFRLYVSLTFDSLLEQAVNQKREWKPERLVYSPLKGEEDLPQDFNLESTGPAYIYYLFGEANTASDYAVTDEDLLEFLHSLQSGANKPKTLFDKFKENHLLFIGCGYENWLERFVIRCITNERLTETRGTSKFVADDQVRGDKSLNFFLKHYDMEVFPTENPAEFVNKLYERWSKQPGKLHPSPETDKGQKAAPTSAPRMETGGIFLSYAHEDRQMVQNMNDALKMANLEVWFDQGDLRPGEAWDNTIKKNVSNCAVFIPFISRQAQQRLKGYFRKEWTWAIDLDQEMDESLRFIQPVILDDMPEGVEHIPSHFWNRHCSRFLEGRPTQEFVDQLKQLVRKMREIEAGFR